MTDYRTTIDALEEQRDDLRAKLGLIDDTISALKALSNGMPDVRAVPSKPKRAARTREWVPSEKFQSKLLEALGRHKKPMTVDELATAAKSSKGGTQTALTMLRDQGKIRLVGQNDNRAFLYTLMESDAS